MIIGVDEVGRGAFAGPVVACAVYLPPNTPKLKEVTDSKLLPEYKRNLLSYQLKKQVKFAISCRPAVYIDKVGIFQATMDALREAVLKLVNFDESKLKDFLILVDGKDKIPYLDCQQKAIVKGDQKIYEISAASIIAKVFRDNLMKSLSQNTHFTNSTNTKAMEHRSIDKLSQNMVKFTVYTDFLSYTSNKRR